MRSIATLSGALAGLMMILIGGMVPSGLLLPGLQLPAKVLHLPSTWQVPALLLSALIGGPKCGILAAISYLTIGLFYLPVFHGGGSIDYLLNPGFGYLLGFIPAAWLSGRISKRVGINKRR